jgi:hypothetical protein
LVDVIPFAFTDLLAAWQQAGELRCRQPGSMFIAGDLCSTA